MTNRIVFVLVTAAMLGPAMARGPGLPDEIPFKLVQGFGIVVRGEVGPISNLNFLLDTGAVPSALSEKVASRIGVRGAKGSLALLDKNLTAEYVTVDNLRFGWVHSLSLPMVVLDLEGLRHVLGTRIDAIVGLDVLDRQSFTVDYKHRRILPRLSGSARHVVPVEIATDRDAPYWVLPIALGGQRFRVLLDTGADDVALFAEHTGRGGIEGATDFMKSDKLTGETAARPLQPSLLVIGDASFQKQQAFVLARPPGNALLQIDGVLGPTALGITRIEFDWEHECLRWDTE